MQTDRTAPRLELGRGRLAFLTVHATGFDPNIDRIVEVAAVVKKEGAPDRTYHRLVYPCAPILPQATLAHGVSDAAVAGAPRFDEIAIGLHRFLGAADLVGFGIRRLGAPLLIAEFQRVHLPFERLSRSVVDLEEVYRHHSPRDLDAAAARYLGRGLPAGADALAEARVCEEILQAQLREHEGMPTTVTDLQAYPSARDCSGLLLRESGLRPWVFAGGRHRGRTPREVALADPDYLRSLLGPGLVFPADMTFEQALLSVAPVDGAPPLP